MADPASSVGEMLNLPALCMIQTRDGTLSQDSKLVNCFAEGAAKGNFIIKRSGIDVVQKNTYTRGLGVFVFNNNFYAFVSSAGQDYIVGITVGGTWSIPAPTGFPSYVGFPYSWLSVYSGSANVIFKNYGGLWSFNGSAVTQLSSSGYPSYNNIATELGIIYLDQTFYVMDSIGGIYGSAVNNANSWSSLNYTGNTGQLTATCLHKHLNYAVAMGIEGCVFYYDNANPVGSPLSAVPNSILTIGTKHAESVCEIADVMYWIGASVTEGIGVYAMEGLNAVKISNPYIDRVLQLQSGTPGAANAFGYSMIMRGHTFYVLSLGTIQLTIAYDTTTKQWYQLTSLDVNGQESWIPFAWSVQGYTENYYQGYLTETNSVNPAGSVYTMDDDSYQDYSGAINMLVRTPSSEYGSLHRKYMPTIYAIGDTINTNLQVRYTDDDFTTYSAYRNLYMGNPLKSLNRNGSSRKRSWDFLHTDNTPMRLQSFNIEVYPGAS